MTTAAQRLGGQTRLTEAEGYLQLSTEIAARWGLRRPLRRALARRALRLAHAAAVPQAQAGRRDLAVGRALLLLGRYALATGPLWSAAKRLPQRRGAWIALAWCLKRSGRLDEAAAVMTRALVVRPDDPVLLYNLACYLAQLGRAENAVRALALALRHDPRLRRRVAGEADFDPIRVHPLFQIWPEL